MHEHPAPVWGSYLSVTQLNAQIRDLLENGFPYVQVRGEVSNLRPTAAGHLYFSLGDGESLVRAVIWRTALRRFPVPPQPGEAVLASGRIAVYTPRGEYQLVVEGLKPVGSGLERERLLQLHARLTAEGFFAVARKRSLPFLPRIIGVVTSATGAVIHDIIRVLDHRFPGYHLLLAHARVQGVGADEEIAAALDRLNADGRAEVILCGRGGGAAEDLAAFNSEVVVRAVVRSRIPVVSAVGHDLDLTLTDLAADATAPTPSAAAERIMPERRELLERLVGLQRRLGRGADQLLERQRGRVALLRGALRHPRRDVELSRQRCDMVQERLQEAALRLVERQRTLCGKWREHLSAWPERKLWMEWRRRCEQDRQALERAAGRWLSHKRAGEWQLLAWRLEAASPWTILQRGYAVVRDREGRVVHASSETIAGAEVEITLARGRLLAQVIRCEEGR